MPTSYPKCSPSEVMGLLVLLNGHKGSEDVALLADDLDLEIDEILPALDYAEVLQLLKVADGRATLTDIGRKLLTQSIRERKTILREQLRKTTLFRALLGALESAPEHRLSEEEMIRLIAFTTAPADEFVQNIINWGRFAELFRYDSSTHVISALHRAAGSRSTTPGVRPPSPGVPGEDESQSGASHDSPESVEISSDKNARLLPAS